MDDGQARQVQVAATAARFVGDAIARMHDASIQHARGSGLQERWLHERLDAELRSARTELRPVLEGSIPAAVTAEHLVHLYELTRTWRSADPDVAHAEHRLLRELHTRCGVTIPSPGPTGPRVARTAGGFS